MRHFLWLVAALLTACAAPAIRQGELRSLPGDICVFSIEARFSVSSDAERHSGRLSWRHAAEADELRLTSPFGQVVAEIDVRPGLARLVTADRRRFEAPDAQSLTREVLGYALPIDLLSAWVVARPLNASRVLTDASGRPTLIEADGWRIEYEYAAELAGNLPVRLVAVREGGPEVHLRIEEWNLE